MKKKMGLFLILLALAFPTHMFAYEYPEDIETSYAKEQILELMGAGIVTGYKDHTFKPFNPITRQEMTTLLVRGMGMEEYAEAIGFVKGDGKNFNPLGNAQRQAAAMLIHGMTLNAEMFSQRALTLILHENGITDIKRLIVMEDGKNQPGCRKNHGGYGIRYIYRIIKRPSLRFHIPEIGEKINTTKKATSLDTPFPYGRGFFFICQAASTVSLSHAFALLASINVSGWASVPVFVQCVSESLRFIHKIINNPRTSFYSTKFCVQ